MTAASFAAIRKVKVGTTDKRYVIDPNTIQNGTDLRLLCLPVIVTDNIPAVSAKNRGCAGLLLQDGRRSRR